jgi:hypothetical protein
VPSYTTVSDAPGPIAVGKENTDVLLVAFGGKDGRPEQDHLEFEQFIEIDDLESPASPFATGHSRGPFGMAVIEAVNGAASIRGAAASNRAAAESATNVRVNTMTPIGKGAGAPVRAAVLRVRSKFPDRNFEVAFPEQSRQGCPDGDGKFLNKKNKDRQQEAFLQASSPPTRPGPRHALLCSW